MKPWLKALIIIGAIVLVATGGIFVYAYLAKNTPVEVTPARNWMLSWMPNQSDIYGFVVSDASQTLVKEKDQTVLEVYVKPGDFVKVGDPLARFDATLNSLTLEEKLLEREKLYNTLQEDYKEYKRWARQEYERTVPTYTPSPSPTPRQKTNSAAYRGFGSKILSDLLNPVSGSGTASDPFRYTIADQETISAPFLETLILLAKDHQRAFYAELTAPKSTILIAANPDGAVTFRVTALDPNPLQPDFNEPRSGDGSKQKPFLFQYASGKDVPAAFLTRLSEQSVERTEILYATLLASGFRVDLQFLPTGGFAFVTTVLDSTPSPTPTPTPTPTPDPSETPEPTEEPYVPIYYGPSKAEREEYARQAAQKIRTEEVQYRQLSLDIEKLQLSGADGIVYSMVEGTVQKALDPASLQDGEVFLEVRGGTGLHVLSVIGEMDLASFPVGTELTGFSYETGADVPVRITEISSMPMSTNYQNGGNPNSSGYVASMELLGDSLPEVGSYIEFTYRPGTENEMNYLHEAYIREIDGQDCIFLVRDGRLSKTVVTTGKRFDEYVELLNITLTQDDYLAFPYDKNARDGAPVTMPSESANLYW